MKTWQQWLENQQFPEKEREIIKNIVRFLIPDTLHYFTPYYKSGHGVSFQSGPNMYLRRTNPKHHMQISIHIIPTKQTMDKPEKHQNSFAKHEEYQSKLISNLDFYVQTEQGEFPIGKTNEHGLLSFSIPNLKPNDPFSLKLV